MSRFAGRHALVTGAGSGIGREVALGLSREGAASVTLVDVDEPALEDLSRELAEASCKAVSIVGDKWRGDLIYAQPRDNAAWRFAGC